MDELKDLILAMKEIITVNVKIFHTMDGIYPKILEELKAIREKVDLQAKAHDLK